MIFNFQDLGRLLLIIGGGIVLVGLMLILGGRLFPWLGRLPGDIHIEGERISCFFPIVTSILLSIILTVLLNIVIRLLNR